MLINKDVIKISNHSLRAITLCDTKATLSALGYIGAPIQDEAPLRCGIAIHEAMEKWFTTGNRVWSLQRFKQTYQKWADIYVPQDHRLAYDNVYRIIDYWFGTHPIESFPFKVIPQFVECSFEMPLTPDGSIVLTGRPDAIVEDEAGKIHIVDHKTMFMMNTGLDIYDLDSQMSGYYWVAQQYGLPVQSIWINAIELKRLNSSSKTCPKHKVPYKECAPQHIKSDFFQFYRSPQMIEEWYKTAVATALKLRTLIDKTPGIEYIGRQRMQGVFNGTCKGCPFFEFCSHNRDVKLADKLMEKK